jgi:NitT/TauT family transport system substrate-binding protein
MRKTATKLLGGKTEMRKKSQIILLLVFMLVILSACGGKNSPSGSASGAPSGTASGSNASAKPVSFSYGISSWIGYAPLYLAKEKGIFEKNGIDVNLVKMEGAADRRTALAANRIQGYSTTVDSHVMTAASDVAVVQVAALDDSFGGDGIVANKEIKSLKDLVGKSVAVETGGGASFFWFLYLLQTEGIKYDDIKVQNLSAGDAGAAFVAKKVDAAVTWEPWLTKAKNTDFGSVLISSDKTPGVIADTIGIRKDFIEKNPQAVKAFVKSWYDALDYYKNNQDEAIAIMAKSMDQTADEFKAALTGVQYYDQAKNKEYFGTKEKPGKLRELTELSSKLWMQYKLIDKQPNIDDLIDYSFIQ